MILSVISICYNNLNGLKKTLESFKNHPHLKDIEFVIIDGNSTDGTKDFLKTQTLTQNYLSEPDKGIYNAMNKGLWRSKGQYIWFLNSGDYAYSPEIISEIIEICHKNTDAIYHLDSQFSFRIIEVFSLTPWSSEYLHDLLYS
jgi:glycosyltransferase involved in cell wall biosynthesis